MKRNFHSRNILIPTVIEKTPGGERYFDIYSRLLEERIIFIGEQIDFHLANLVVAQILYLEHKNPKRDINIYINSVGGIVDAGFAIYDAMCYVAPDIVTIGVGLAGSMGAFLLAGGTKGKRYILPNARVMIHQPMGGAKGQATDVEIVARELVKDKQKLVEYLVQFTGKQKAHVSKDVERDYWMNAKEAQKYGLVDNVMSYKKKTWKPIYA